MRGGSSRSGHYLDNLDIVLDGDLESALGIPGLRAHFYILNNSGGRPNEVAQTLQGVDNIEVASARTRLYEAWLEQDLGGSATLRAGLYDLNSEFYSTEASDLLIAPPFGIGSELASTGPNGPSIFPLTSLAARVRVGGESGTYYQAAVLHAEAGLLNEPDKLQFNMNRGAILIAEAGHVGRMRLAAGAWSYTLKQDNIRKTNPDGSPAHSNAFGGYVLGEGRISGEDDGRRTRAFFRAGASDGDTTPFLGGWQIGLRWDHVIPSRPDSSASIGLHQGLLSKKFRANGRDAGVDLGTSESGVEITYSDTVGRLSIQPDLQVIHRPGGEKNRRNAVIAGVRFTVDLD